VNVEAGLHQRRVLTLGDKSSVRKSRLHRIDVDLGGAHFDQAARYISLAIDVARPRP
jgi:hypothetical protein